MPTRAKINRRDDATAALERCGDGTDGRRRDPWHIRQCNDPAVGGATRGDPGCETCAHALVGALANDDTGALRCEQLGNGNIAWSDYCDNVLDRRAQMSIRCDRERRAGAHAMRIGRQRDAQLLATEALRATCREQNAD